jgi:hypothetical protein
LSPSLLAQAEIDTTRIHRVAGRTGGCTALITTQPFRGGLCDAMAMSTGIGIHCEAVREGIV